MIAEIMLFLSASATYRSMEMVQLLISTLNEGIERVGQMLLSPDDGLCYLVSHQITRTDCIAIPKDLQRDDVQVVQTKGVGLSANRNQAIRCASGDIVVLLDDDVRIKPEYMETIRSIFASHPEVDVSCCMIKTSDSDSEYKVYSGKAQPYQKISDLKSCSSIEISFRLEAIRNNNIRFDERFGLGTQIQSGEELLFLNECLRKGLHIHYFPVYTVEHPFWSSVKKKSPFSDERLFAAGAQSFMLYGKTGCLRNLFSALRRLPELGKEKVSVWHFLKVKQAGYRFIRQNEQSF